MTALVDEARDETKMPPMTTAPRGNFVGRVLANVPLCREHYRLTIVIPDFPTSRPGQFVQLSCRDRELDAVDHEFDWSPDQKAEVVGREFQSHDAFLRRPFSIAGRRDRADGAAEIDIIGREVGPGTRFLASLKAGDELGVLGPLGNGFTLPDDVNTVLLVGGGVGIPPMLYCSQSLPEREAVRPDQCDVEKTVAFAGAVTAELLPLTLNGSPPQYERDQGPGLPALLEPMYHVTEFAQHGTPALVTTDDGSVGLKGYVTDALERWLDDFRSEPWEREHTMIYTCGPEPMMKRVQQIAESRGIRCQIAVERAMACGMGTCQSCCIRVKKPDPEQPPLPGKSWCYRLACTDGPVFGGDVLLW